MERLLHYVWKYKLYAGVELCTTEGDPVMVIDPGLENIHAGPDFTNSKIKIGNNVWAGNVEIHTRASDWIRHHHQQDPLYDTIILHVVEKDDLDIYRGSGEKIPQLILPVPENVSKNIEWLLYREQPMPCLSLLPQLDSFHISGWLDYLLTERLERKTDEIIHLLELYQGDWNEVFYISLCRSFGFGINGDAFESLARSLPYRYLLKQRGNALQIEALFFGQAGMLDEELPCPYYQSLQQEYHFLKHKYQLRSMSPSLYKKLRTRPANFPHVRLAQLAALFIREDTLFSLLLKEETPERLKECLKVYPSDYWHTHYHFHHPAPASRKSLSEHSLHVLLINTVVPVWFAYGRKQQRPDYMEKALLLLERIPCEKNSVVRLFTKAGIQGEHAGISQALIQLKREYCEKKKCLYCRIGFQLLRNVPFLVK